MKKLELALIGIAFLGILMKILEIPKAGIIIVVSFTAIAIVYKMLEFALFNDIPFKGILKKENFPLLNSNGILSSLSPGLPLSIAVVGILFKLQNWPFAKTLLMVGLGGLLIVLIFYFFKLQKKNNKYNTNMIQRVIIYGAICVFLILIPQKTWLTWNYPNYPEFVNAALDVHDNPDNRELFDKYIEERDKMDEDMKNK